MDRKQRKALIRERLHQMIVESGYTQGEIADMIDTSQSQVNSWATGKSFPGIVKLAELCEALETNPTWALGEGSRRFL